MENGSTDNAAGPEPQVQRKFRSVFIGPDTHGVVDGLFLLRDLLHGPDLFFVFCLLARLPLCGTAGPCRLTSTHVEPP